MGFNSDSITLTDLILSDLSSIESFKDWRRITFNKTTTVEKVIADLLSILYSVKVKDKVDGKWVTLIPLDKPNYKILPKSKDN